MERDLTYQGDNHNEVKSSNITLVLISTRNMSSNDWPNECAKTGPQAILAFYLSRQILIKNHLSL